jgi:hypothetical protein
MSKLRKVNGNDEVIHKIPLHPLLLYSSDLLCIMA